MGEDNTVPSPNSQNVEVTEAILKRRHGFTIKPVGGIAARCLTKQHARKLLKTATNNRTACRKTHWPMLEGHGNHEASVRSEFYRISIYGPFRAAVVTFHVL